jgi:phosphoglucomutase
MMENFRQNPPQTIAGSKVVTIKDYKVLKRTDNGVVSDFEMPTTSNVLQWFTEDGLKVSVRPSGTEPKIKFYCEVPVPGQFDGDYVAATAKADARVEEIKKDLGL